MFFDSLAVITRPGALSRRPETAAVECLLRTMGCRYATLLRCSFKSAQAQTVFCLTLVHFAVSAAFVSQEHWMEVMSLKSASRFTWEWEVAPMQKVRLALCPPAATNLPPFIQLQASISCAPWLNRWACTSQLCA